MKFNIATLLAFSLLLIYPLNIAADDPGTGGRKIRLDEESVGGYRIRVVTSPIRALVNNLFLEIRLTDPSSGARITDANVWITATSGADIVEVQATHTNAPIPDEYAARILIPYAGVWEIIIGIDGPLGRGEVSFLERVSNPSSVGAIISVGAPIVGLIILGLIFYRLRPKPMDQ